MNRQPVVTSMVIGSVLLGGIGGVAGLVVGLHAYPPTAWFAVLEIGLPAGAGGCLLGLGVGLVVRLTRRRRTPVDDDFAESPPGW